MTPLITVGAIVGLAVFFVFFPVALHAWQRYRHRRAVTCPQTNGVAEIGLDARHAAWTSIFGKTRLRIKECSLWPKRKGCPENCFERD